MEHRRTFRKSDFNGPTCTRSNGASGHVGVALGEHEAIPAGRLGAWVRSTSLGWALGLILLIVLVLGSEMIGLGSAQTPVGLGVELLQSRALGGLLPKARLWTFASVAGHLIPFLAYDLAQAAGLSVLYSLHVCVALSGVIAGALQQPSTSRLLYPEVPILGLITGVVLVRLPRRSAAALHAASRGA